MQLVIKEKKYTMDNNNDIVNIVDEEDTTNTNVINPPTNMLLNQIKSRIQSNSFKYTIPDKLKNTIAC